MKYYIRFTKTAEADVNRGTSIDVFSDEETEGIYAFSFSGKEEYEFGGADLEEDAIKKARSIANWNGAGYAEESEGDFAVIEGKSIDSGNDGVLIQPERVVFKGNINDEF